MTRIAKRAERIEPFYVMEVAKAAKTIERNQKAGDAAMVYLNIGEPDFTAPPLVQEAALKAIADGKSQYTHALGLDDLRQRLSDWYARRFGLQISAQRIVITAGASAALQLACLALIEAGDEILMPDPSYPCNRQFVSAADGRAVMLPCDASSRFQLGADQVAEHWKPQTRGVLLASPSNPTGTSIDPLEIAKIHERVCQQGGITLVDEIYLGLSFDDRYGQSALAIDEQVISINSFSKYFNMTGWRLGWLVLPTHLVPVVERLAQNLFICPSTIAQHAALACFETESLDLYEQRRAQFKLRRDTFIPALAKVGLEVPVMPDGAFYAWADCTQLLKKLGLPGSWELSFELMKQAALAVAPGRDFGQARTQNFLRFSTASSMDNLQIALQRLQALWERS
jgi:aspartate/methionine/tyrosine aminotransferase